MDHLKNLGKALQDFRELVLKESRESFRARLGITAPTLRAMERGEPGVAIGTWVAAMELMGTAELAIAAARPSAAIAMQMASRAELSSRGMDLKKLFNSDGDEDGPGGASLP